MISMEKKSARILVVDDDPYISELIEKTLEAEGFLVTLASDGKVALAKIPEDKPDLVLLDIRMPGLTGIEVLEQIRKNSEIPVIMLTGMDDRDSLVRSLELGANDYIKKPFTLQELLARIRAKLRRANY